jgi:acetylornithine deacetylase/succinyl-diaminopimelate desuccinylase-like protein
VTTRDAALQQVEEAVATICERRGISWQRQRLNVDAPALCDPRLVQTVAEVCTELGLRVKRMVSRAYHDTLFMAQLCPVTMIFIPCRGGVSHRPDEFTSAEQIGRGVAVLARTLVRLAG